MAVISGVQGLWQVDLIVNETAIDINTNTSTASWELWIRRTDSGNYPMYGTPTVNIYVSGQQVYSASKYYSLPSITNSGVKLESGTISNLPHNNETGIINNNSASFTWSGSGFSPSSVSGSGTYQTATIPRNSTITATSAYVGETSQLTITKYKDEYTHSIAYSFGNLSGYILANGSTTSTETKLTALSIGFPIPSSWYEQMPNTQEAQCVLTIKTYNGNTQVGSDYTATFYVRVSQSSSSPIVTASVEDSNNTTYGLTGDRNVLIKGYSTANVTWSATAQNYSAISNVKINGTTVTTSPTSFTLNTDTISVTATDSRGFTTLNSPTFTLKNYAKATIIMPTIYRANPTDNYATLSFNGTWFNESFGAYQNALFISWKYREEGQSTWLNGGVLTKDTDYVVNGNNFWSGTGSSTEEIQVGGNLLTYDKSWDVVIIATDMLDISLMNGSITKGIPIINWGEDFFNVNGDIKQNDISIFNKFNYIENEEIVVGSYDDGNNIVPVYRKVFVGTSSYVDAVNIDLASLNANIILNAYGWVKAIYGQWWPLSSHYPPDYHYDTTINYDTNTRLNVHCESYYSYPEYRIVLEYTKTTD